MLQQSFPVTRHRMTAPLASPRERAWRYMHVVHEVARNLKSGLPRFVEIEDLIQLGFIGLLEANLQYVGPSVGFPKYARSRVRASMLQDISAADTGSRRLRRIMRHVDECSRELEQSLGRTPSAVEYAAASGLTLESYQSILSEKYVLRRGLKTVLSRTRHFRAAPGADPLQAALISSEVKSLRKAFLRLSSRERRMLKLHYGEGIKLKAIGTSFEVTESRVSQILSQALVRLRVGLG
jgi:RNA polymerase sigma factor for flagellar operon FliA